LHGLDLPGLVPKGSFVAVGTDFRRAILKNLSLKTTTAPPDLRYAFFTCATLVNAKFGQANVGEADFSGADLTGADLSNVSNLTAEQLHGAKVTANTLLPAGVHATATPWGAQKCADITNLMTGMLQGQGYDPATQCPTNVASWGDSLSHRRFKGNVNDLIAVCSGRIS
jgi:hypothetical protein